MDTSALVEIALAAPCGQDCSRALLEADQLFVSAGTVTETLIVSTGCDVEPQMAAILDRFGFTVILLAEERAKATARAYQRYGRGWHAASLNFGDCFAYVLAKELDCPLLFVGDGFATTDVKSALA